jgi:hypothetical protein
MNAASFATIGGENNVAILAVPEPGIFGLLAAVLAILECNGVLRRRVRQSPS